MIDFENKTAINIDISLLEQIAADICGKDFELIITDNQDIKEINNQFRQIDKSTDVLSFPYDDISLQGSIIISYDFAKEYSKQYGDTIDEELALLFIHGILHTLGYDHESDNGEMRAKEAEIIRLYNLPASLIVRTEFIFNDSL